MATESSQPSRRSLFAVLAAWLAWLLGPRPAPAAPAARFVTERPGTMTWSTYLGGSGAAVEGASPGVAGPSNSGAVVGDITRGTITSTEFDPAARRTRTRTYDKDGRLVSDETRPW